MTKITPAVFRLSDEVRCEEEVAEVAHVHADAHGALPSGSQAADLVKDHWQFKTMLIHLISLMHGVALARLRSDYRVSSFEVCPASSFCPFQPSRTAVAIRVCCSECLFDCVSGTWNPENTVGA